MGHLALPGQNDIFLSTFFHCGRCQASPWDSLVRCNNVNRTKNILQCKYMLCFVSRCPSLVFLARLSTDIYCNYCLLCRRNHYLVRSRPTAGIRENTQEFFSDISGSAVASQDLGDTEKVPLQLFSDWGWRQLAGGRRDTLLSGGGGGGGGILAIIHQCLVTSYQLNNHNITVLILQLSNNVSQQDNFIKAFRYNSLMYGLSVNSCSFCNLDFPTHW